MIRSLVTLGLVSALAGCAVSQAPASSDDAALVGGGADAAHPAVGYLVGRITSGPQAGQVVRGFCTATLIAPNAVLTVATCVDPEFSRESVEVVGVGFGDVASAQTYEAVGAPTDWYDPIRVRSFTRPSGETFRWIDPRYNVAVIPLGSAPPGIVPMVLNTDPIAPYTPAKAISYGKIVESLPGDEDTIEGLANGASGYPRVRHAVTLEIENARNFVEAYPLEGDTATGMCFRDFGAPLVLAGGQIAGVLSNWSDEVFTAAMFDGLALCRGGTGAKFANFRFSTNGSFIASKVAAAAAANGAAGQ